MRDKHKTGKQKTCLRAGRILVRLAKHINNFNSSYAIQRAWFETPSL